MIESFAILTLFLPQNQLTRKPDSKNFQNPLNTVPPQQIWKLAKRLNLNSKSKSKPEKLSTRPVTNSYLIR